MEALIKEVKETTVSDELKKYLGFIQDTIKRISFNLEKEVTRAFIHGYRNKHRTYLIII